MDSVLFLIAIAIIIFLLVRRSGSSQAQRTGQAASSQELRDLQSEFQSLRRSISAIDSRLTVLEKNRGLPASEPQVDGSPAVTAEATAQGAPTVEQWESPVAEAPHSESATPKRTEVKEREWEQILGGNWLAKIGAIALVIGVGFFLKFAFDNNWIGPTGRIILGIIVGIALLAGGYFWRKRYPILSQAISGAGIAILYLSVYAAFAVYSLIHFYAALAFLFLVSVVSAALALLYDSMSLAIIGIVGAFGAPSILAVPGARSTAGWAPWIAGTDFRLLAYAIVVDIGVLALSTFRNWSWFTLLALLGSLSLYGAWTDLQGYRGIVALVGLTPFFLIFVGATTLFHIIWRRPPQEFDQALMVINAAAYFGISYGLLWADYHDWLGGFSVLLAIFYAGIAYIALKRSATNATLSLFALGIALVFLTIAVPVQLGNRAWTTIAWAAEGTILVWFSFTLRMPGLRNYAYAVFSVMAIRLLFFDQLVNIRTFQPIFNARFLAFFVSIVALYIAGYLMRIKRDALREGEKGAWSVYPILFVAANFFTVWVLSAEVWGYFTKLIGPSSRFAAGGLFSARSFSLTTLWAIYAVALLVVGIVKRWRAVRLFGLALIFIPIIKVFIWDVFTLRQIYRIIAFVGLGVILLASAYLYQRYSQRIRGFIGK